METKGSAPLLQSCPEPNNNKWRFIVKSRRFIVKTSNNLEIVALNIVEYYVVIGR